MPPKNALRGKSATSAVSKSQRGRQARGNEQGERQPLLEKESEVLNTTASTSTAPVELGDIAINLSPVETGTAQANAASAAGPSAPANEAAEGDDDTWLERAAAFLNNRSDSEEESTAALSIPTTSQAAPSASAANARQNPLASFRAESKLPLPPRIQSPKPQAHKPLKTTNPISGSGFSRDRSYLVGTASASVARDEVLEESVTNPKTGSKKEDKKVKKVTDSTSKAKKNKTKSNARTTSQAPQTKHDVEKAESILDVEFERLLSTIENIPQDNYKSSIDAWLALMSYISASQAAAKYLSTLSIFERIRLAIRKDAQKINESSPQKAVHLYRLLEAILEQCYWLRADYLPTHLPEKPYKTCQAELNRLHEITFGGLWEKLPPWSRKTLIGLAGTAIVATGGYFLTTKVLIPIGESAVQSKQQVDASVEAARNTEFMPSAVCQLLAIDNCMTMQNTAANTIANFGKNLTNFIVTGLSNGLWLLLGNDALMLSGFLLALYRVTKDPDKKLNVCDKKPLHTLLNSPGFDDEKATFQQFLIARARSRVSAAPPRAVAAIEEVITPNPLRQEEKVNPSLASSASASAPPVNAAKEDLPPPEVPVLSPRRQAPITREAGAASSRATQATPFSTELKAAVALHGRGQGQLHARKNTRTNNRQSETPPVTSGIATVGSLQHRAATHSSRQTATGPLPMDPQRKRKEARPG